MDRQLKVFALDDCDWWVGYDLDSVIKAAREEFGEASYPDAEREAVELDDNDLRRLKFSDDNGNPIFTFGERLSHIESEFSGPCFFASTEQ